MISPVSLRYNSPLYNEHYNSLVFYVAMISPVFLRYDIPLYNENYNSLVYYVAMIVLYS